MTVLLVHVLAILATILPFTTANFDLYHIHGVKAEGSWPGSEINGWQLQNDNPSCEQVDQYAVWRDSGDLSHGRLGIRCEGKCGYGDAPWPDVKLIEMHFTNNPLYHFTIYKDRGYEVNGAWRWYLYGTDGKSYGDCFAWGDYNWDCQWPNEHLAAKGYRKFRCITDVDANTINDEYKKEGGRALAVASNTTLVA
ncbi:hypothetical protein SLS60_004788 [Paraconiothyrium brasiliense]|uniref:Uncharacterized protein n=1 Tax=Paraconiothyrium brasiliense TaxID=300254 RepID=A0ABR3RLC8_9PLEO